MREVVWGDASRSAGHQQNVRRLLQRRISLALRLRVLPGDMVLWRRNYRAGVRL